MKSHEDRVRGIHSTFSEATDHLIACLQQLNDNIVTRAPAGAWTPAQIGCHVALTNEFLAAVLSGAVGEMNVPRPDGFQETLATLQLPDRVKTFPALEPPAGASKRDAVAKLRQSADVFAKSLSAATSERCGSVCVKMPFGVVFSIYEVGEFATGHIHRHIGQVNRTVAL